MELGTKPKYQYVSCDHGCRNRVAAFYYVIYDLSSKEQKYYKNKGYRCVPCLYKNPQYVLNVSSLVLNEYNKYKLSKNKIIDMPNTMEVIEISANNISNTIFNNTSEVTEIPVNNMLNATSDIPNNISALATNTFNINIIQNKEIFKMTFTNTNLLELNKQLRILFCSDGILEYDVKNNVYTYIL